MPSPSRSLTAEQFREKLRAETTLARMHCHEDLARCAETDACELVRHHCTRRYRELLGCHPEDRDDFQQLLEHIRSGAGLTVAEAIASLRHRYWENGDGSASAS